jgi:hypothetical protein
MQVEVKVDANIAAQEITQQTKKPATDSFGHSYK